MSLTERARHWIEHDPDPETRAELSQIVGAGDDAELAARVDGSLEFGTAGIRAEVGAGPLRMNRAVIRRTTWGVARYLVDRHGPAPHVVVGRDARLSSESFWQETIDVLHGAGCEVTAFGEPVPTPLVAFTARELGAEAAIVITASHNPPADNGYKVYDANAAQIIPPVDEDIAAVIADAPPADEVPLATTAWEAPPVDVTERYVAAALAARLSGVDGSHLRFVYTPLHGVGGDLFERLLGEAGHRGGVAVPEQRRPDGRFPTVTFPNPEEPGSLDLALALGEEIGADLVLGNDPDADRLAVAVPGPDGGWRRLSGNELGLLLGDALCAEPGAATPLFLNSIVSTPAAGLVAAHRGAHWETTLTGFKWIWNAALDLERAGVGEFRFGFEEALGYSVSPAVRDKDGISAGLVLMDLAARAEGEGRTLLGLLDDLARRHGVWVSRPRNLALEGGEGQARIAAAMDRAAEGVPDRLGGSEVTAVVDFRRQADPRPRWLPATEMVAWELDGGRLVLRPSGTEPKLKIYADFVADPGGGSAAELTEARRVAADAADAAANDLLGRLGLA